MKGIVARLLLLLLLASPVMAQRIVIITGGTVTANVTDSADFYVTLNQNVTGVTLTSTVTPATGYLVSMKFVQDATGSRTVVFGGNISTSCAVNSTANSVTICRWQYTASSNTWADAAGGAAANSPIPANQAQGPTYNVRNYGATGDAQKILDGVTAGSGGHTVTSATAQFDVGVVGKKMVCAGAGTTPQMPISTITVRNSATQVTTDGTDNGAASGLRCIWYTKDDTTAFTSANTAANPAIASKDPNVGPTLGGLPGSVYCPEGGYAVSARIFHFAGAGSSIGPNFIGAGKNKCIIYIIPGLVDPADGFAVLMDFYNGIGGVMKGFTVDGIGYGGGNFAHPVVQFNAAQQFVMDDVNITNISTNQAFNGTLDFLNSSNGVISNVYLQGGGGQGNDFACGFSGVTSTVFRNLTCSNHNRNGYFANNGSAGVRSVFGDNGPTFIDVTFDECGSASQNCYFFDVKGSANFFGGWIGVGNTNRYAMDLNAATSRVWLTDVNCGQYGSTTNNSGCATMAAGSKLYVTGSTIRGNNTGVIFNGPATAFLYDLGGNDYFNCVSAVCTAATTAQSFSGGIFPVFPLPSDAITQLGGRQVVAGAAPTCSVTGAGSTATCTIDTGSTDAAGKFTITANGAGIAALGTFTLTFTTGFGAYGTNGTNCSSNFMNGTGAWNVRAGAPIYTTLGTTTSVANWDNNAVALTGGSTYKVSYTCYGQ